MRAEAPAQTQSIAPQTTAELLVNHLRALHEKGVLTKESGQAPSLRVWSPLVALKQRVVDIPVLGSLPAEFADDLEEEAKGCVSIDIETLGIQPTPPHLRPRSPGRFDDGQVHHGWRPRGA